MNPTRPNPTTEHTDWLIGPDDLSAINHDDRLLTRLGRGELPDPHDPRSRRRAALLGAWLDEVEAGSAR